MTDRGATELAVIDEVLADAAGAHGVPGAVAGVLRGDAMHVAAHGVGNAELPRPVDGDTLFQVGSISKTFVSAALMILVEQGRLTLEDPVARHLPTLGPATGLDTEAMTVAHTISHRTGFDGDHLLVFGGDAGLDALADARRFFAPGDGFSYSNAGFSIAGAVLAAVAGRPFEAVIRDLLLRPLGMDAAGFRADWVITRDVAVPHWVFEGTPYVIRGAGWQPGWELAAPDWAAGGLIASAHHLLRWCRFQRSGTADDGSPILSAESLARLHAPVVNADVIEDVALDWFVHETDGVRSIEHGGVTPGYVCDLVVVPERDVAFVGLTNATNGTAVNRTVRRAALAALAGITEEDPRPDASVPVDLARVCGRYESAFEVLEVTPGDEPGSVVVTPAARAVDGWQPPLDPPRRCAFFAPHHIVSVDDVGPAVIGRFDEAATPASWLQWSSRRAPRIGPYT